MRYHNITKDDMLNGDGLRAVLWLAGCEHHCKGCQNPITWDPEGGIEFDEAAKAELFDILGRDYIDKVTQEIQTVQKDLALTRVTAGDDMVALSVGLSVMEKGNKAIIEGLKALGFRQIRREKVTERCVKPEYQGYKYRVILEKDLQEAEE